MGVEHERTWRQEPPVDDSETPEDDERDPDQPLTTAYREAARLGANLHELVAAARNVIATEGDTWQTMSMTKGYHVAGHTVEFREGPNEWPLARKRLLEALAPFDDVEV